MLLFLTILEETSTVPAMLLRFALHQVSFTAPQTL